jgi:hypothetical protein
MGRAHRSPPWRRSEAASILGRPLRDASLRLKKSTQPRPGSTRTRPACLDLRGESPRPSRTLHPPVFMPPTNPIPIPQVHPAQRRPPSAPRDRETHHPPPERPPIPLPPSPHPTSSHLQHPAVPPRIPPLPPTARPKAHPAPTQTLHQHHCANTSHPGSAPTPCQSPPQATETPTPLPPPKTTHPKPPKAPAPPQEPPQSQLPTPRTANDFSIIDFKVCPSQLPCQAFRNDFIFSFL